MFIWRHHKPAYHEFNMSWRNYQRDLTNVFHQWRLDEETTRRLAIQTPWGLVEPQFMPERLSPGMAYLQTGMKQMFGHLDEWCVVIFDNVLIGCNDQKDACYKLKTFLEVCQEHNVHLKMSKTWLGFPVVKFFGYEVSFGKYELGDERKKAVTEIEMPTSQKSMQRFLGAALFFKSFVANYSDAATLLHKMTHKDFNWDTKTWKADYVGAFKKLKEALVASVALYFPDYELPWTLRVDASNIAVGAVLLQIRTLPDGTERFEPIGFARKKFSQTADNWDPYKKEAFACYFGVDHFAYYLRGKPFILETDHRNLQWIENSEVPMVVRWRVFMQSFSLFIRHIPGTKNMVADWLSRADTTLFYLKPEDFYAKAHTSSDICCLMSILISDEEDLQRRSPKRNASSDLTIPSYAEPERISHPRDDNVTTKEARELILSSPGGPISDRVEQHRPFSDSRTNQEQMLAASGDEVISPDVADVADLDERPDPEVIHTGTGRDAVVVHEIIWTADQMFKEVHGGRKMHWGARRTWLALNKRFPGHKIPFRFIQEKIEECVVCRLYRQTFSTHVEPITSHLKPAHSRGRVGFDGLTITQPDKDGNTHLVVIVDFFKKYVWAHVAKNYEAVSIAKALFIYYCTFGVFDEVWTDSGSNILNDVVEQLNKWLQVQHVVALVDRHQTCGVEGSNKQILRHVRTITFDFRIKDRWSDPIILCLVLFVINDAINSETGVRPLDAMFGSADGPYLRLPTDALPADITNAWVRALDEDLKHIRSISAEFQRKLIEERTAATPEATQNTYQPGDIVLWTRDKTKPLPHKLDGQFRGPYEVVQQNRNIVMCRHLADSSRVVPLFVDRLQLHVGSRDSALEAARVDLDQYVVTAVLAWKGDPAHRRDMKFWVVYDDGDAMWVSWKPDLVACQQYQDYIHSHPELFLLCYNFTDAPRFVSRMRNQPIVVVEPGDTVYIDLRAIKGCQFFDSLELPNAYFTNYVCECTYIRWIGANHKRLSIHCNILDVDLKDYDSFDVFRHGAVKIFDPTTMTLVDPALCVAFPRILEGRNRARLLKLYTPLRPGGGEGEGGNVVAALTRTISDLLPNPATPTDLATAWTMLCKLLGTTSNSS